MLFPVTHHQPQDKRMLVVGHKEAVNLYFSFASRQGKDYEEDSTVCRCYPWPEINSQRLAKDNRFLIPKSSYKWIHLAPPCRFIHNMLQEVPEGESQTVGFLLGGFHL